MRVTFNAFRLQKAGNSADEYEDWSHRRDLSESDHLFRAAVADGATETSFSDVWAKILVRAYSNGKLAPELISEQLPPLRCRWAYIVRRRPLPWYAEEKLAAGAFAAIVGLTVVDTIESGRVWTAMAVGDSCLFHVRGCQILSSFPLSKSDEFNSRPTLLSSNARTSENVTAIVQSIEGTWQSGDQFYLITDAFACWFLRRAELAEDQAISSIRSLTTHDCFVAFVEDQRKRGNDIDGSLKNDDVTLAIVSVI